MKIIIQSIERKQKPRNASVSVKHIVQIACTIPKGAELFNQIYGKGIFLSYESKFRIISVRFGTRVKNFRYHEVFMKDHICAAGAIYQRVQEDIQNAIRE